MTGGWRRGLREHRPGAVVGGAGPPGCRGSGGVSSAAAPRIAASCL